ncbi:cytochrome b/b6 domain-containing protein [Variovorax sp. JS1663]|uniref:cytochrome b/b6 domain-containing protein n=1 Tax=Variovorax sp. JS1663 TaxID=1851577 RepID=UPI000B733794|nr:cytochrome b/b6 domain-containing protein [Variovorax sp. JS1663]OUL99316.1 hypothetical protein A8M77_27145 [Variovorax sp. JS1663]
MNNPTSNTPLLPFLRVLVWDAPVRVCYALMVACFTGAYLTAGQEEWRIVHATSGYTLGGLAIFRIIWGFAGTRYARFSSFLRGPGAIANQLRQLPYGWAKRHIGHSPVGALLIIGVLMLSLVAGASGWASSGTPAADWLEQFHTTAANVLLAVAGLHIATVAFGSWRAGENPVLSMIRGSKLGSADESIQNARGGVALLLVAAVLGFWWYQLESAGAATSAPEQRTPVTEVHRGQDGDKP